jgi:hypothetical protein
MHGNTVWVIIIVTACLLIGLIVMSIYTHFVGTVCKRKKHEDTKICKKLPLIPTDRGPVTVFTIVHFIAGVVVAYFTKITAWQWLVLNILFEIWESTSPAIRMFNSKPSVYMRECASKLVGFELWSPEYAGDSVINQILDTGSAMLGFYIGMKLRVSESLKPESLKPETLTL